MAFNDTISNLTGTSTFYDWFQKENNEIISKLNLIQVSSVTGGDGVLVGLSASSGLATLSIGGTSGNIKSGLTFSGSVSFLGETVFPNISYKITGVTTGTPGYTFGSVVRITSSGYTLAQANGADNAEVIGIVSAINSSYSVVTISGKIDGNFTTVAGGTLSPGCVYFLDGQTAGFVTTTEPNTIGFVSKPVMIGIGQTAGMVVQYRGNFLNSSTSGGGLSGSNLIYVSFSKTPTDPTTIGFTLGTFLSYAPHIAGASAAGNGVTFFNQVLIDTGRTAINKGWFISGSKNFISRLYTPGTPFYNLPWEDDFVVGMIQSSVTSGSNIIYEIVTKGYSTVIPLGVSSKTQNDGIYYLAGTTYIVGARGVTGQLTSGATSSESAYQPVYQLGRNFASSTPPRNFYVDIRPLMNSPITSSFKSTAVPETLTNGSNKTYNGDFSIWQRNTGNKSGGYTAFGDVYFADGWIRRQSGFKFTTTSTQNLEKKTFDKTDTSVEGTPTNYVDIKCLESLSSALNTDTSTPVYSIGHVVDNVETFSNTAITVSFYAKTAVFDNNFKINVYFARYGSGSLLEKKIIGQITPQSNWTKHTLTYNVPAYTDVTKYTNDYVEIGLDLNPLIRTAYTSAIASSTNVTISVASMCVYPGTYSSPAHMFLTTTEKLKIAQKYYYTTYSDSQISGTQTMLSQTEPTLNTFSLTHLPNSAFGLLKLPSQMRTSPTVSVFSPYSGVSNQMYNYTASRDQKDTSGTRGYNGATRSAPWSTQPVSTSADTTTVRVNIDAGSVFYDVLNCHLIVDASYPI